MTVERRAYRLECVGNGDGDGVLIGLRWYSRNLRQANVKGWKRNGLMPASFVVFTFKTPEIQGLLKLFEDLRTALGLINSGIWNVD